MPLHIFHADILPRSSEMNSSSLQKESSSNFRNCTLSRTGQWIAGTSIMAQPSRCKDRFLHHSLQGRPLLSGQIVLPWHCNWQQSVSRLGRHLSGNQSNKSEYPNSVLISVPVIAAFKSDRLVSLLLWLKGLWRSYCSFIIITRSNWSRERRVPRGAGTAA